MRIGGVNPFEKKGIDAMSPEELENLDESQLAEKPPTAEESAMNDILSDAAANEPTEEVEIVGDIDVPDVPNAQDNGSAQPHNAVDPEKQNLIEALEQEKLKVKEEDNFFNS